MTVVKWAHRVPLGMEDVGSFRLAELLAPCNIPVHALKNIACRVLKESAL